MLRFARAELAFEEVDLGQMVAHVPKRWGKAAPNRRPQEHPGDFFAHGSLKVDGVSRQVRWHIGMVLQVVI